MKTQANYSIDWSNIDLNSPYERNQNILDPYDFDTLLLEINCNLGDKANKESVEKHFNAILKAKMNEAKEIFRDNLDNVLNHHKNS